MNTPRGDAPHNALRVTVGTPRWPAVLVAALAGAAAATVGALAGPASARPWVVGAGAGLALLAAATRSVWLCGLTGAVVVGDVALGRHAPTSAVVVALAALLTAFCLAAQWPGRPAVRGVTPAALVVAVPAAAVIGAAAGLDERGTAIFVVGLALAAAALGAAFAAVVAARGR